MKESIMKMPVDKSAKMRDEYDFSAGVRGKYAKRFAEGTNFIRIDEDLAELFPDSDSVNEALRAVAALIRKMTKAAKSPTR